MAVLIKKKPNRYQTVGTIGISESDLEQADRLDARLEKQLKKLIASLEIKGILPRKKGKGTLLAYWKLGRALRDVTSNKKDFPFNDELPLLWRNAKIYLPEELLYKERGPHREHLWYCYRLGGYPEKLIKKMKWGEWNTIFDSPGINQEPRFDTWFQNKLTIERKSQEREKIRMFVPCVNVILSNIDVHELNNSELFNCYETAWSIASIWLKKNRSDPNFSDMRRDIQNKIKENFILIDDVMEGIKTPEEFSRLIV